MLLADMGARVIRIERPDAPHASPAAISQRGRAQRYAADLKNPEDVAAVRLLVRSADALIEGFRPGTGQRAIFESGSIRRHGSHVGDSDQHPRIQQARPRHRRHVHQDDEPARRNGPDLRPGPADGRQARLTGSPP
jgi:hypothetical protein